MYLDMIDANLLFVIVGMLLALLGIIVVILGIVRWVKSGSRISTRLEQFVVADQTTAEPPPLIRRIIPREIDGSLFSRTVVSWFSSLFKFLGKFAPRRMASQIEHKLTIAGHPMNMHAGDFYALRLLFLIAGLVAAFLINRDLKHLDATSALIGILIIAAAYLLPNSWLNSKVRAKQDEIRRGLPDALDMLSVCASAGLGFDQSLQKIASYWESDLGLEFRRVIHEMEMGVARPIALKNMAERLDVDDLSRFITIIVQAETMGMSYADVLHSQAAQMRILRQYRAREIANRLPAKMIVPLALLIFPALIAVILGPVIPTIITLF
ncbi:MAG: type II secretion system F family protein [Anaerolineaceae bacterium]|nr:type II secretion system F family protein [Anaerolineaceae bacterium]